MELIKKILGVFLLIIMSFSCASDDNNEGAQQNRTLIFGWFADSSCSGDCSQIYKITSDKIFRDLDIEYPEDNYFEGNFQEITTVNYQDYSALLNQLPNEIFNEPNGYLDCPECTNELGGLYLEYEDDEIHKTWRIRSAQFPSYIDSYKTLLLDKLADLNSL